MPFFASVEGVFGYGKPVTSAVDPTNPIVAGNATVTMSSNNYIAIPGVAGQDDSFGYIPTSNFNFFFFGSNYGSNQAAPNAIYWNTNNVVGFGTGNGTIQWVANTGRGILCGNYDRRTNAAYYSTAVTTGNFQYLPIRVWFQNLYSDGIANAGQMQIRLARNTVSGSQYVEFRIATTVTTAGYGTNSNWNITDGTSFKNTFGTTFASSYPAANTSFVIASDSTGTNWTLSNTSYLNF